MPIWRKNKIKELNKVAEKIEINSDVQLNVLNYENLIIKLLKFKTTYSDLLDGSISFNILEYGKFKIIVEDNIPIVEPFHGECDIELNHLATMQLLLSPIGVYLVENNNIKRMITLWFPLPLYIQTQDKV